MKQKYVPASYIHRVNLIFFGISMNYNKGLMVFL